MTSRYYLLIYNNDVISNQEEKEIKVQIENKV